MGSLYYLKASDFAVLPFYYGISVRNGSFLAAYQEGIDIITTKGDKNFPYDDVYLMNDNTPQTIASAIEYMQDNSLKSEHTYDFYIFRKHCIRRILPIEAIHSFNSFFITYSFIFI